MDPLHNAEQLVRSFNWHSPSWDLFIILFWVVASTMYAFAAGRGRILTILISVYMSKLLVLSAPFLSTGVAHKLNITVVSVQQLVTFVLIFLILFIFLGRYAFKSSVDSRRISSLPMSLVFALLQVGLLINIILTYLPKTVQGSFHPLIQTVFIKDPASFIWLVLPVLFLILLGRFLSERSEM